MLRHDEAHYPLHDLAAIAREQTSDAGEKDGLGGKTGRHVVPKCADEGKRGSHLIAQDAHRLGVPLWDLLIQISAPPWDQLEPRALLGCRSPSPRL